MQRIRSIEENEKNDRQRNLIVSAEKTGAPDPRIVSVFVRNEDAGAGWTEFWNKLLYEGLLPAKLKEMVRIHISVAHNCGYCSTVRSVPAQEEGLTEEIIVEMMNWRDSDIFSDRERAALHYAELFKSGDGAIDSDEVYNDLRQHFSDEEIIELGILCAQTDGMGKFARSINIVSWGEACAINPALANAPAEAAE